MTDFRKEIKGTSKTPSGNPDNTITLDISQVKTLQIGYQAETLYLLEAPDDMLTIKEYIGLDRDEFFAKISSNRIKTTIRHGRREVVNTDSCVEIFLPASFKGEFQISSQYGDIISDCSWALDRFTAESSEGMISLNTIIAPRIRLATSTKPITLNKAEGFADVHSVDGPINIKTITGGGRLNTSSSPISACFDALNSVVECETLNGPIALVLPAEGGMIVDGVSKTGEIHSEIDGLNIKVKPGNVKNITGTIGTKPFQKVRISTINGQIDLSRL